MTERRTLITSCSGLTASLLRVYPRFRRVTWAELDTALFSFGCTRDWFFCPQRPTEDSCLGSWWNMFGGHPESLHRTRDRASRERLHNRLDLVLTRAEAQGRLVWRTTHDVLFERDYWQNNINILLVQHGYAPPAFKDCNEYDCCKLEPLTEVMQTWVDRHDLPLRVIGQP